MQTAIAISAFKATNRVPAQPRPHLRDVSRDAPGCDRCSLRMLCLPAGLTDEEVKQLHDCVSDRRRVKRGEILWQSGDPLDTLFAIRVGFLKSFVITRDGQIQVIRFQMSGEIIGMDAIATGRHNSTVVALEDTEVCAIPFRDLDRLMERVPGLRRQLFRIMSEEIVSKQESMALLGTMRAEQRLASFLLRLSSLYKQRGYSATEFVLRMTREELGNYLGLKLETVSRLLSKLQKEGLIRVESKSVKLLDVAALGLLEGRETLDA